VPVRCTNSATNLACSSSEGRDDAASSVSVISSPFRVPHTFRRCEKCVEAPPRGTVETVDGLQYFRVFSHSGSNTTLKVTFDFDNN
jgi:hypothetical protein